MCVSGPACVRAGRLGCARAGRLSFALHSVGRRPRGEQLRDWVATVCSMSFLGDVATKNAAGCTRDILHVRFISLHSALLRATALLAAQSCMFNHYHCLVYYSCAVPCRPFFARCTVRVQHAARVACSRWIARSQRVGQTQRGRQSAHIATSTTSLRCWRPSCSARCGKYVGGGLLEASEWGRRSVGAEVLT